MPPNTQFQGSVLNPEIVYWDMSLSDFDFFTKMSIPTDPLFSDTPFTKGIYWDTRSQYEIYPREGHGSYLGISLGFVAALLPKKYGINAGNEMFLTLGWVAKNRGWVEDFLGENLDSFSRDLSPSDAFLDALPKTQEYQKYVQDLEERFFLGNYDFEIVNQEQALKDFESDWRRALREIWRRSGRYVQDLTDELEDRLWEKYREKNAEELEDYAMDKVGEAEDEYFRDEVWPEIQKQATEKCLRHYSASEDEPDYTLEKYIEYLLSQLKVRHLKTGARYWGPKSGLPLQLSFSTLKKALALVLIRPGRRAKKLSTYSPYELQKLRETFDAINKKCLQLGFPLPMWYTSD